MCSQERLPYTLAIHRGGANGENPHAHLMFSERGHDGIERDAEQWFKRYNAKAPEKGGARKSRMGALVKGRGRNRDRGGPETSWLQGRRCRVRIASVSK